MSFATGLKTIVVATDLHGQPEAALDCARKLATHYEARIVLAHGTDPLEYAGLGGVPAEAIAQHRPCLPVAGVKRASDTPGTAFALLACSRVPVMCVPPGSVARRLEPAA
jgi:nucleotide-binding universal stress UspA family protein